MLGGNIESYLHVCCAILMKSHRSLLMAKLFIFGCFAVILGAVRLGLPISQTRKQAVEGVSGQQW